MSIKTPTLYAIVDHQGVPYMSEHCVAPHPDMLADELAALNDELISDGVNPDLHYRVKPLYAESDHPDQAKIDNLYRALDAIEANAIEVNRGGNLSPSEVHALVLSAVMPAINEFLQ